MKGDESSGQLFEELRALIKQLKPKEILGLITEKARNIEIEKREGFENALLRLAQNKANKKVRPILYEAMVSLQAIWEQYFPKKNIQKEFWASIKAGNLENALLNYKELAKQGLDYLGTVKKKEGKLIPLIVDKENLLLNYNQKELTLYNLELNELIDTKVHEFLTIIDVMVLLPSKNQGSIDFKEQSKSKTNLFILIENKRKEKRILTIDLEDLIALKSIDQSLLKQCSIDLDKQTDNATHLSFYKSHLLILSKKTIYYRKDKKWEKWYSTENEITAFASTRKGFWVGHANGDVFILKDLDRVGVRDTFKEYSETINRIRKSAEYVIIFCKTSLCITDHVGNLILGPIKAGGDIIHADILKNEWVLVHLANGMLIARELKQGNICWEINLGEVYKNLFLFQSYLYCGNRNGQIELFEIPRVSPMIECLKGKNIYVDNLWVETIPNVPVKYVSDFIGRTELLNEIKNEGNAHFLLYSEPKVGKTSLLNVLRDTLAEKA